MPNGSQSSVVRVVSITDSVGPNPAPSSDPSAVEISAVDLGVEAMDQSGARDQVEIDANAAANNMAQKQDQFLYIDKDGKCGRTQGTPLAGCHRLCKNSDNDAGPGNPATFYMGQLDTEIESPVGVLSKIGNIFTSRRGSQFSRGLKFKNSTKPLGTASLTYEKDPSTGQVTLTARSANRKDAAFLLQHSLNALECSGKDISIIEFTRAPNDSKSDREIMYAAFAKAGVKTLIASSTTGEDCNYEYQAFLKKMGISNQQTKSKPVQEKYLKPSQPVKVFLGVPHDALRKAAKQLTGPPWPPLPAQQPILPYNNTTSPSPTSPSPPPSTSSPSTSTSPPSTSSPRRP